MPGIMSPTALMLTVAGTAAGFFAAAEGDFGAGRGLAAGAGGGVELTFCTPGFDVRGLLVAVLEDL